MLAGKIESDTDTDTNAYEPCDDGHTDTDVRTDDACGSATLVHIHVQIGEDGGYDTKSQLRRRSASDELCGEVRHDRTHHLRGAGAHRARSP